MRNYTVNIYGADEENNIVATICAPAFGEAPESETGYIRRLVLNDGEHRVKVFLYHRDRPLEVVKTVVRAGLESQVKRCHLR